MTDKPENLQEKPKIFELIDIALANPEASDEELERLWDAAMLAEREKRE